MEEGWASDSDLPGLGSRSGEMDKLHDQATQLLSLLEEEGQSRLTSPSHEDLKRQTRQRLILDLKTMTKQLRTSKSSWRKLVTGDVDKSVRQHLQEKRKQPGVVRFIDKMSFTGGVFGLMLTELILIQYPEHFWILYSAVIPLLLGLRYYIYRRLRFHYFMIDFCYFANLMCFLGLFVFPKSITLFHVNFTFAIGPLSWAIVAWRNGLVFHSLDKVTSLFIHYLPLLLMFSLRWYPGEKALNAEVVDQPMSFFWVLGISLFWYLFWQVSYFLKTELVDKAFLDSNPELQTSLRWLARDSKNFMHKNVLKLVRKIGLYKKDENFDPSSLKTKVSFMVFQLLFTICTCLPTALLYKYYYAHLIFLLLVFFFSVFNGASYYFDVFSVRYVSKFEKKAEKEH